MTKRRLEELLARYEPRLARRFRSVMARVKSERTIAALEVALETGAIGDVIDSIEAAAQAFASDVAAIDAIVGAEVAEYLTANAGKLISYNGTNARAIGVLQAHRARFVWGATTTQRQTITDVIAKGLADGVNPRQIAVGIRDVIGLTPERAKWVANYRRALETADRKALTYTLRDKRSDKATRAAIKAGKPLPQARIDSLVDRYAARQIASRAETIARTEALRALHAAQDEAYEQAIEAGSIDKTRIQDEWHAGDPPRTRGHHASMDGQLRKYGETFRSGHGVALRYPGDENAGASETANCRCLRTRKILPEGKAPVGEADEQATTAAA